MAGANEQKLREHLASSRVWQVLLAESQWSQGSQALAKVAQAIEEARPLARENLGQHTADRADTAFVAMQQKVKQRQEQLKKGAEALAEAKQAISRAQAVVNGFDRDGDLTEPTPPDWSDDEIRQIQQLKVHGSRMTAYNNAVAAREEAARAAIQDVDTTNQSSTATMRDIQGKPPLDSGGGGGGSGTPGGGGGALPPSGGTSPRAYDPPTHTTLEPATGGTHDPPTYDPPIDPPIDPTIDPPTGEPPSGEPPTGEPGSETGQGNPTVLTTPPSSGSFGGTAGALGGGLAGGAIGMGAIRAGALGGATPASGTRPIGSTPRSGASGALGRSTAAGGIPTRGAAAGAGRGAATGGAGAGAGRGSGGRGAGGAGTGAHGAGGRGSGGRGAGARAGGAGAGAGAGGRGGRGKGEQSSQVDHLHDDQDWIDDEDGSPGVID